MASGDSANDLLQATVAAYSNKIPAAFCFFSSRILKGHKHFYTYVEYACT